MATTTVAEFAMLAESTFSLHFGKFFPHHYVMRNRSKYFLATRVSELMVTPVVVVCKELKVVCTDGPA